MLVAKFNCPSCEAPLKPAAPVQSGKKLKCPKCTRVIVVPAPEDDVEEFDEVVETVEEVEPVRKRSRPSREEIEEERPGNRRAAREDEEDERPARRRADREDEEDDEEAERPRKPKKKAKKKARGGGSGLKVALFSVLAMLLLGGAGFGVYFLISSLGGDPGVKVLDDTTAVLAGVKDQASATAARPALVALGHRMREVTARALAAEQKTTLDPDAFRRAMDEAARNPEKAKAEAERLEKKRQVGKTAAQNMVKEMVRVGGVPGGRELLDAFFDALGEEGAQLRSLIGMVTTKANFASVQSGMTEQQVTALLGKPINVVNGQSGSRTLFFIAGTVEIKDGKVAGKSP